MTEKDLQDYVLGSLPQDRVEEIATAIDNDPELAQKVAEYKLILGSFHQQRQQNRFAELQAFEADLPHPQLPNTTNNSGNWKWWIPGVALVVTLAFFGWRSSIADGEDQDLTQLAIELFDPPPDPSVAGTIRETERLYYQAMSYYANKDYEAASQGLAVLKTDSIYGPTALLYLPHTIFYTGDYERAADEFTVAIAYPEYDMSTQLRLRWNSMLTDLARGIDIRPRLQEDWGRRYAEDLKRLEEATKE